MATPPPEAAPVPKEEKPQLPPSPNGISSVDVGRKEYVYLQSTFGNMELIADCLFTACRVL